MLKHTTTASQVLLSYHAIMRGKMHKWKTRLGLRVPATLRTVKFSVTWRWHKCRDERFQICYYLALRKYFKMQVTYKVKVHCSQLLHQLLVSLMGSNVVSQVFVIILLFLRLFSSLSAQKRFSNNTYSILYLAQSYTVAVMMQQRPTMLMNNLLQSLLRYKDCEIIACF